MQTTRDSVTALQAAILARLIHGEAARAMIEQAERVAQAVETDRQQAILWLHQTLNHETVTCMILMALGFDRLVVDAADTLSIRYRESVRDYAKRIAACDDTDVLAVAVALIENQIKEGVEHQDGHAGGVEEGTPCAEARHRRPGEPAARIHAAGWRGGRQPPDGAGPAQRVDEVDRPHQRRAGSDDANDAWPGQRALGGQRAPVAGRS